MVCDVWCAHAQEFLGSQFGVVMAVVWGLGLLVRWGRARAGQSRDLGTWAAQQSRALSKGPLAARMTQARSAAACLWLARAAAFWWR